MKQFDVITIGSAVRDVMFLTTDAETFRNPHRDPNKLQLIGFEYGAKIHSDEVQRYYGGGANNTAVGLSRLGLRVAACICVGKDADGVATVAHLKSEHVNTQFVQQSSKRNTGFSFLVVEKATHEHVAFVDYGANEELTVPTSVVRAQPRWFYISSLSTKHWPSLIRSVAAGQSRVAWNPGAIQLEKPAKLKPLLKKITVLILNRDESTELTKLAGASSANLAQAIYGLGPKVVVVTDGRKGATVYDGQKLYRTNGSLAAPKDTTGAGDAFGSSFVGGLIKFNNNVPKALRLATLNASAEVAKAGAQNGLLTWKQIPNTLKR